VRFTLCGFVGSELTVTASVALSADVVVGLNVTATVHDELAASVGPHVPPVMVKSLAFVPLTPLPSDRVKGE
jgi:hypothetical protein